MAVMARCARPAHPRQPPGQHPAGSPNSPPIWRAAHEENTGARRQRQGRRKSPLKLLKQDKNR